MGGVVVGSVIIVVCSFVGDMYDVFVLCEGIWCEVGRKCCNDSYIGCIVIIVGDFIFCFVCSI